MKVTSIKNIYLKEYELKQAIVEYLEKTEEDLAQHLYDNNCSMEWKDEEYFVVSIDGEAEEVLPEAGNTNYPHSRLFCVAYQEGGVGCPDCYDFICDGCGKGREGEPAEATIAADYRTGVVMCEECSGGNTTERVEEQTERLEKITEQKKINKVFDQITSCANKAAQQVMKDHKETFQKLAEGENKQPFTNDKTK